MPPKIKDVINVGDMVRVSSVENIFYSHGFQELQPGLSHYEGTREQPLQLEEGVPFDCPVIETYEVPYKQLEHFPNRPQMMSMIKCLMVYQGQPVIYHFSNFSVYGLGLKLELKYGDKLYSFGKPENADTTSDSLIVKP
jgi:hypothetical protein